MIDMTSARASVAKQQNTGWMALWARDLWPHPMAPVWLDDLTMFVRAVGAVPLEWAVARAALERSVHDGGLVVESRRAQDAGDAFLMQVHPKARFRLAKQVKVQVLPVRLVDEVATVAFRWEATGPTGGLFPMVDGDLVLTTDHAGTTAVTVTASYRPPLSWFGAALDRTVLDGLAEETMQGLVQAVIAKLIANAGPGSAAKAGDTTPKRQNRATT
jgi:hypothetical protein